LQKWVHQFGRRYGIDHVTRRRYLIDEKYLVRDSAGDVYQRGALETLTDTFDAALFKLDLVQLIDAAKAARELKKQQYRQQNE
jgi:hypothetical protein